MRMTEHIVRRPALTALAALALLLTTVTPTWGHSLKVWARAEQGAVIRGRVYFPGGGRAAGVAVRVLGPDGRQVAETMSDDAGEFAYIAQVRGDHTFVAQTGDGHRAEFTVSASALPTDLPELQGSAADGTQAVRQQTEARPDVDMATVEPAATNAAEIERLVDRAVSRQVGELAAQVEAYESRRRVSDIIGGIGYIIGLAGLVLWMKSRSRGKPGGSGAKG